LKTDLGTLDEFRKSVESFAEKVEKPLKQITNLKKR